MYYSSGNYEAFARPKKPEGVDNKSAYIVGSGLAALTAACYLVRDGQIVSPVRGASLIGKGNQILMRIDRVGKHMTMGQGMCGSLSGSVPTNVGQPPIRVSSLTAGGK